MSDCDLTASGSTRTAQAPPRVADPCTVVMFGASGDLAKRKLVPAVYNLRREKLLNDEFAILGVGREPIAPDRYREKIQGDIAEFGSPPIDADLSAWLAARSTFLTGAYDDDATYRRLEQELVSPQKRANVLFYLATPPSLFETIVERLGSAKLTDESAGWRRVVIEKPFGHDLASARALNNAIRTVLRERQIYRIDHYLGKETVQNIMTFRFGNGIFEPIWNRRYIDHVQITVAETVGVEQRGGYYDTTGALRDMVQNHLFQLLAVTTMEPPASFRPEQVRDERLKVLEAVRAFAEESARRDVVRGQYAGYRREPKVAPDSQTETYTALKVLIDNWRWAEVPFYLRTGKRLPTRATEIAIQFKRPPLALFREGPSDVMPSNRLVLRIQPHEGISLQFEAKVPGPRVQLGTVNMDFSYADYFGQSPSTGYETLLYDCMVGDATLFHRADIVEAGWALVEPILEAWRAGTAAPVAEYPAGSWGPPQADDLLRRDCRAWHNPSE